MEIISVKTSDSYDVYVGSGIFTNISDNIAAATRAKKICIVSDETVWPLWGNSVMDPLTKAGYLCCNFLIPSGEDQKRIENCTRLWEYLAAQGFDRQDCLIALGGGVIGDLTGFAAATYLRGIDYIQIPTTLLAMVDSSVGGKTAVNLQAGKNLAGVFYQPRLVLCNIDTLSSLPHSIFLDGCAEVIKYAVLFDPQLFSYLEKAGPQFSRESVISCCIHHKAQVVRNDEFDQSERLLLNLGHTVGHAIEALSNYSVSHGQAVAAGMACISRCALSSGCIDWHDCNRILELLKDFSLPTATVYTASELCKVMVQDKKRNQNTLQMIMPIEIGKCSVIPVAQEKLCDFIAKGL